MGFVCSVNIAMLVIMIKGSRKAYEENRKSIKELSDLPILAIIINQLSMQSCKCIYHINSVSTGL